MYLVVCPADDLTMPPTNYRRFACPPHIRLVIARVVGMDQGHSRLRSLSIIAPVGLVVAGLIVAAVFIFTGQDATPLNSVATTPMTSLSLSLISPSPISVSQFNALSAINASQIVTVWAKIPAWVDTIVSARPYPSVAAVVKEAAVKGAKWTMADLDSALSTHPAIGQKATGNDAEAQASRREQSAMASASQSTAEQMAHLNQVYTKKFGRVFLIRAAGRPADEMLAELMRRLDNDASTEFKEAKGQLMEIIALRITSSLHD